VPISSEADARPDEPLRGFGDKAAFVTRIEQALIEGRADVAVHSLKDLPATTTPGLWLASYLPREDPRDVLISGSGLILAELAPGSSVGTSSLRRARQLELHRPDLKYVDIRGNVDTRLRKLDQGEYAAIVLAAAGLARLGLSDRVTEYIDTAVCLPAPGQGIIALQCRENYEFGEELMQAGDANARSAAEAERAVARQVEATCTTPFGALLRIQGENATMDAWLGLENGADSRAHVVGQVGSELELAARAAAELLVRTRNHGPPASLR
jgi:hydroxymethylbilane synthase